MTMHSCTLSSYPRMMSRALPSLSFTHSSVIVAPKETNFAVIEPSGAAIVVTSNGFEVVTLVNQ